MKLFLLAILSFIGFAANAQSITGTIISEENKQPIAGANVYISNSSLGTISNNAGNFELNNLPKGNLTLVVSFVGYETFTYAFEAKQELPIQIKIELKIKPKELDKVTVSTFEKDGFTKWGQFFINNFIGEMEEAKSCILKNPEALKFRFDKTENKLYVIAFSPLIIQNKALGYSIKYDLEGFEYSFSDKILLYYGYALFADMDTKRKGKIKRWQKKRTEVYNGSMTHFMRSLYNNSFAADGFEVRRIIKTPNYEKERVKSIVKSRIITQIGNSKTVTINIGGDIKNDSTDKDSTDYYNRILHEPNEKTFLINTLLNADSISTFLPDTTKELSFENYLLINYKNKMEPSAYLARNWKTANKQPGFVSSEIFLLGSKKIKVYERGIFFSPTEILSDGWWGWSEKIATLLPLDFNP